ncbi:MAG TPA: cytochrome c [Caldilineae bacterium]|nr:cytochrome c [Caldilineae bacterium]
MSRKIDRRQRRQAKVRRRRMTYAAIAGGALLIVALFALAVVNGSKPAEPLANEETIALGQQVYEQTCAACHGAQGEGHAAIAEAPALDETEHAWHHPDGQIQQLIINGGQQMPALGEQLSDEEIVAVIRYIQTWWDPAQLAQQQDRSRQMPLQ